MRSAWQMRITETGGAGGLDTETRRAALKAIRAAEWNGEHAAEVKGRTG